MRNQKKSYRNITDTRKSIHKISDPVMLSSDGYNIDKWEKLLVEKCIQDNPSSVHNELSSLLGMSTRNFYRICKAYNIDISVEGRRRRFNDMINEFNNKQKEDANNN